MKLKTKPKSPKPQRFVLTLDEREARDLSLLLGAIGGTPAGIRATTDEIYHRLAGALNLPPSPLPQSERDRRAGLVLHL